MALIYLTQPSSQNFTEITRSTIFQQWSTQKEGSLRVNLTVTEYVNGYVTLTVVQHSHDN